MPTDAPQLAYTRATLAARPDPDGPVEFVASQPKANRYGFALRPDGWLLDNFRANPVFLWMHNPMTPPIGRVEASQRGGELRAAVTFDPGDELAQVVERKYRAGFLNAVSVGWGFVNKDGSPVKDWWRLTPEQIASKEVFYDLEEISGVSVPGDPRAVRKQSRRALARLGRELLDLFDAPDPDPDELAAQLREQVDAALVAALGRLGMPAPPFTTTYANGTNAMTTTSVTLTLPDHPTTTVPDGDPAGPAAGDLPAGDPPAALDPRAVQELLAAVSLQREG